MSLYLPRDGPPNRPIREIGAVFVFGERIVSPPAETSALPGLVSSQSKPSQVAVRGDGNHLKRDLKVNLDHIEQRPFVPKSLTPLRTLPARTLAAARRRVRVAFLIEEEGLDRGARTRIAGWLGVSLSTICRDIRALLAAGDPIVTAAFDRSSRHRLALA